MQNQSLVRTRVTPSSFVVEDDCSDKTGAKAAYHATVDLSQCGYARAEFECKQMNIIGL